MFLVYDKDDRVTLVKQYDHKIVAQAERVIELFISDDNLYIVPVKSRKLENTVVMTLDELRGKV